MADTPFPALPSAAWSIPAAMSEQAPGRPARAPGQAATGGRRSGRVHHRTPPVSPLVRWGRRVLVAALCATALVVMQQSAVVLVADWQSTLARNRIDKWAANREDWTDEQWEGAQRDLRDTLSLTPEDATLYDALAQLYSLRANRVWTTGEPGTPEMALYEQARQAQEASIRLRPLFPNSWAGLALIHYALNSPPEDTFGTWRRALALGPYEPQVQQTLLQVAELTWLFAPTDVRDWADKTRPGFAERVEHKLLATAREAAMAERAAAEAEAAQAADGAASAASAATR